MKRTLLVTFTALALIATGCKKNTDEMITPVDPPVVTPPVVVPPAPKAFALTEDFEAGVKGAYAVGNITMATGSWEFNDALIGNLAADVKNGNRSVRLRTGSISMNFDIQNLSQIKINHAKYGNDATSTWQLMMSIDGGATYTQLGSTINETTNTFVADSFAVATKAKIRFKIIKAGTTRINIDDIVFKGTGDPGITVGTPEAPIDPETGTGTAAAPRPVVTTGTDVPPTTGDNSNLLMGNPSNAQTSIATSDNYLIDMGYYTESYNASKGTPNWVSWHLDNSNTTNATGRLDNFAAWSGLPSSFFAVQSNSYKDSGFDRGHNCPSADRTSSTAANGATFLMTNMIPQAPNNNQKPWNELEQYLRSQTLQGNEVYIIMGSYGTGGVGSASTATVNTIAGGKITVPANVWKVAVVIPVGNSDIIRTQVNTRVIAINTPNVNSITSTDWTRYIVTVRSIEQATGYNLLSSLPQSVQDVIETGKDTGI